MKILSQFLVTLLMLDAAWVAYGLLHHWDMWPWIVIYWMVLTVKNAVDWINAREVHK